MPALLVKYAHTWKLCNAYGLPLATAPLRIKLVNSNYVFNAAHTQWDNGANDATDPSFNEIANGNGYTLGGQLLQNPTVTNTTIGFDNPSWPSLTATFRAAIIIASGTFNAVVDPLLTYLLFDTTPADMVSNDSEFKVMWNDLYKVFYDPQ